MKHISHSANGKEYLLVDLPEDAANISLADYGTHQVLGYKCAKDETSVTLDEPYFYNIYSIVGRQQDLSEEQAMEIVEKLPRRQNDINMVGDYWRNYASTAHFWFFAVDSLASLASYHGMNNPIILQKQ